MGMANLANKKRFVALHHNSKQRFLSCNDVQHIKQQQYHKGTGVGLVRRYC
jgi:hypothetical protein